MQRKKHKVSYLKRVLIAWYLFSFLIRWLKIVRSLMNGMQMNRSLKLFCLVKGKGGKDGGVEST
jgi:hypothetical protein